MIGAVDVEEVQSRQRFMNPYQGFAFRRNVALGQRQMDFVGGAVGIGVQREFAVGCPYRLGDAAFNQRLVLAAELDQIGNRADFQAVFVGEADQVRQTGHRAVFLEYFADDRRRLQAGHLRQIATGFGMSGAHQHAAVAGGNREDVAGLDDVFRPGITCHGGLDGARTVMRRNAGGNALCRFDGNGEGSVVRTAVVARHRREAQLPGTGGGDGQADQAACVRGHEVDGFGRDVFGRENQIAFVFTVFFIHQDDHAPGTHFRQNFLDRRNCRFAVVRAHQRAS